MMSVIWMRRLGKSEIWHACADFWDTNSLCGLPTKLRTEYSYNPTGERCPTCEQKRETPHGPDNREAAPTAD